MSSRTISSLWGPGGGQVRPQRPDRRPGSRIATAGSMATSALLWLAWAAMAAELARADAFIKVSRFQVPKVVNLGERAHLACHYELSGETLHALKLYKDGAEFYRYTPRRDELGEPAQRQAFAQPGVQVELAASGERDVWLRPASKQTGGTYKCQVIVENTFKSISVERQLEVRTQPGGRQQQQPPRHRHAVQHQQQQLQHHQQPEKKGQSDGDEQAALAAAGASSSARGFYNLTLAGHLQAASILLLLATTLSGRPVTWRRRRQLSQSDH